jgi:hypothetical protein
VRALRGFGIDAEVDLHHLSERGVDWTRFGPRAIVERDWVIVALSPAWRDRWEGVNAPTVGAGAVAEADALRSVFAENQQAFRDKVVLVTLPSMAGAGAIVPTGLHGVQRFTITGFELEPLAALLRLLTGQGEYPPAPLGQIPQLPPAVAGPVGAVTGVTATNESTLTDAHEPVREPRTRRPSRRIGFAGPLAGAAADPLRTAVDVLLYAAGTAAFAGAGYVVAHTLA